MLSAVRADVRADVRVGGEISQPVRPKVDHRLQWLDALRGIAVLAVVVGHLTFLVFAELRQTIMPWFDSGKYGVMVFFLVSGYIIPASLERHGSIGRFWMGRAFRLYPLLLVAVASYLLLIAVGLESSDGRIGGDPVTSVLAHATFLQALLGVPNFVNVLWTLSYEMVFYLLVAALFVAGAQRRGGGIALVLAVSAILVAPVLPTVAYSRDPAITRWVVSLTVAVVVAGIVCAARRGRGSRLTGAIALGGLALALILFNQRGGAWEGMVVLTVMFTGTTIYRAERAQIGRHTALWIIGSAWALTLLGGVWNFHLWAQVSGTSARHAQQSWIIVILLTGATFAVAWLLRARRFPRVLVWIGVVSYSIYLMHTVLLSVFRWIFDSASGTLSFPAQAGIALAYFAVLFVVAWTTHRFVEVPGQQWGRRIARRLR
jgi:peptidoglycan/LPS O-acetylase OafA/YrhL